MANHSRINTRRFSGGFGLNFFLSTLIILLFFPFYPFGQNINTLSFDSFSQENGLPNNIIQCIFQDSKGWIWFGTSRGLSRFDGYRFTNFIPSTDDSTSLNGNLVRVIFEDRKGNLLVGTENGGLNVFNRDKENFSHPYKNHPELLFREVSVNALAEDASGNLWIGTESNLLVADTLGNLSAVNPSIRPGQEVFAGNFIRNLVFDKQGHLWIGTNNGVFIYHPVNNEVEFFVLPGYSSPNREIWEIYYDNEGIIWIGIYGGGVYTVDPTTFKTSHILLEPVFTRTETVRSIAKGELGDYWIGTRGGLYVYSKIRGVTAFFRHDERDNRSLSNNSVLDIFHDAAGETWIGTRGGVNLLAKSKQAFRTFSALPNDNRYLNSSIVYALWVGDDGKIWIGTEDGGVNIFNPVTGTYEYLMSEPGNKNSIQRNCIKAFLDDKKGNLWIGTFWGGIGVLNLQAKTMAHYLHNPAKPQSLSDNRVWSLFLDSRQNIWVGTNSGLDRFDPASGGFIHYSRITSGRAVNWISEDSGSTLWIGTTDEIILYEPVSGKISRFAERSRWWIEDSKHRFWVCTLGRGIALYSKENGPVEYFTEANGLANNQSLCILEGNDNNLWVSTSNGLSKFDPENGTFLNFTDKDGLQNNQFSYGAAWKSKTGELLFGGISGFTLFNPRDIKTSGHNPPVVLTDFRIFNRPVPIGGGKKPVLKKSISETSHIALDYSQNVFTIEFAALNYVNSASNLYSYFLEGFDKEWTEPGTSHSATYTNLDPGEYALNIRHIVPGFKEESDNLKLGITINPPYWRTFWFRGGILLLLIALFFSLIKMITNREKLKNELALERMRARELHELDMLKLRFFTNISHEIRTPLTLILGPLEKLISKQVPEPEIPSHLGLIQRNAKNLDNLITQILDFRKLETGNLKFEPTQDDMVRFLSDIVHSFDGYAQEKGVTLKFNSLKKKLVARFDPDKIGKIINNLLSNAFKFTNPGDTISVNLSLVFDGEEELQAPENEKQSIEISVKDTGQGIAQSNLDKIFIRFFQAGKNQVQVGTGIGLSLVKELVKLHNGTISVTSKPGKGTKFTIRIPYEKEWATLAPVDAAPVSTVVNSPGNIVEPEIAKEGASPEKILLIVEDNADVRFFIKSHFTHRFRVYEAKNGQEGWERALEFIPDVIVSDILMPDVDGYEFCRKIKKDERTSHIPLILLTALHSKEHKIQGLSYGADDFITKPFDPAILEAKVENLLSIRKSLKEKYSGEFLLQPKNILITSPDERFLQKAIEVVEARLSDTSLDIESFASEVGVSRMQLYRKLNALTDMTVKEFIRSIRLKRAAQLLLQKKMTVSEIAYEVGFKDLSHFRKCFRQEFGMNSSEYIEKNSSAS